MSHVHPGRAARIAALKAAAKQRILILDGAWGVMIQKRKLAEADYRGDRFKDHPVDMKGNNDILCLTRPDIIADIVAAHRHAKRRTPGPDVDGAGARLVRGLAGVLAGGLVVLALGLVAVEWAAGNSGVPGPGSGAIVAHVGAAVVAVVGQVVADRRRDRTGLLAALGVVVTASLVLGFGWFL